MGSEGAHLRPPIPPGARLGRLRGSEHQIWCHQSVLSTSCCGISLTSATRYCPTGGMWSHEEKGGGLMDTKFTRYQHVIHTWRHADGRIRAAVLADHADAIDCVRCGCCMRALESGFSVYTYAEADAIARNDPNFGDPCGPRGSAGGSSCLVLHLGETNYYDQATEQPGGHGRTAREGRGGLQLGPTRRNLEG